MQGRGTKRSKRPAPATAVLSYLRSYHRDHSVFPSIQSIVEQFTFSGKSAVTRRLLELEQGGYLSFVPLVQADRRRRPRMRMSAGEKFFEAAQASSKPEAALPIDAVPLARAAVDPLHLRLPMAGMNVSLGFPSPAEDFLDRELDLNELMIRTPAATFLYRAKGVSMRDKGITDGDILVVDRSLKPKTNDVVLAYWGGNNAVCKILKKFPDRIELHSAAPDLPPTILSGDEQVEVYVVTGCIKQFR